MPFSVPSSGASARLGLLALVDSDHPDCFYFPIELGTSKNSRGSAAGDQVSAALCSSGNHLKSLWGFVYVILLAS